MDEAAEPEHVVAIRQRLATAQASLRSTEAAIEASVEALTRQHAGRKDARRRVAELERWLSENGYQS